MATLLEIYGIEEAVSAAWNTVLTDGLSDAGLSAQVIIPDADDDTQTNTAKVPRVEITAENNGNEDHVRIGDEFSYFDEWRMNVKLRLVTDRVRGNASHKLLRRLCRVIGHTTGRTTWEAAHANYQCFEIKEAASTYSVDDENKLDITEMNFEHVIRVAAGAWPS